MSDMRELFLGAIRIQEEVINDAKRRIEHYNWALTEMDKENSIVEAEPVDPKMLEICKAIVKDCA